MEKLQRFLSNNILAFCTEEKFSKNDKVLV